ncbi:dienelactone hydrolase family protein [Streptomyces sp. NRRL WC-3742]|uniref:dienelactone hydrolase family protein n=1 Tax=Streptomyces sp. NRRL WC-3742 TaxID=1463934 RepID=UPI0004C9B873|nr:dienelactone hydrolase family protein [Streptomyces sp. NRRL WC-3742]
MSPSLLFTTDSTSPGIREREFTVDGVPGVLWSPASEDAHRAPLVLMAHGGGRHRKHQSMAGRASRLVADQGFHVAVLDLPAHGDRPRSAHDEAEIAEMHRARQAGESVAPVAIRWNAHLAEIAAPEYRALLDALQALPEIGPDGPVGFVGLALGTAIGIPYVASDPRITAAVFGLHWPDELAAHARRITVPVQYAMQWDDEVIPREASLALFDAFASPAKTLHANAGRHMAYPRFEEADSAARFLARHLTH